MANGSLVIHTINRAQIINDAWSLSKASELNFLTALRTIEYLGNEDEYVPWQAASYQFTYVSRMLMMSSIYGKYSNVMKSLIGNPFNTVGMNASVTESHTRKMFRILLTNQACTYNVETCVTTAKSLFKAWMDDSSHVNRIDPDIKQAVYCTAISEGGAEEWDFLYSQYKSSNNAAEKKRILYALSCTKQTWILSKYLLMSLDPKEIRGQDIVYVISYVAEQSAGRDIAWNFVNDKWDYLIQQFGQGQFSFSGIIRAISVTLNTEYNMDQLLQFQRSHPDLSSGRQAFTQALESTETNIRWMRENLHIISDWLDSRINAR
ncbi:aminopeptidase N-like [Argopecten irradians]|uniref:aminopeptidase N-like n=1 Tax=Argopecten irradians TaxID=31199 RepID=UPI003721FECA